MENSRTAVHAQRAQIDALKKLPQTSRVINLHPLIEKRVDQSTGATSRHIESKALTHTLRLCHSAKVMRRL